MKLSTKQPNQTINAPLRLKQTKTKWYSFNLNTFRNAFYNTNAKMKIAMSEALHSQIEAMTPVVGQVHVQIVLYAKTKSKFDISNVCSIVDKFAIDALVTGKILEEDNWGVIPRVLYVFGGFDKKNPRAEITIIPLNKESI